MVGKPELSELQEHIFGDGNLLHVTLALLPYWRHTSH